MDLSITLVVDVELIDSVVCGHRAAAGPWADVAAALPLGVARPGRVPVTATVRAWREFCCVAGCQPNLRGRALRLHEQMVHAFADQAIRVV